MRPEDADERGRLAGQSRCAFCSRCFGSGIRRRCSAKKATEYGALGTAPVINASMGGAEPSAPTQQPCPVGQQRRAGDYVFGFNIPCISSQLTKASNQPVLVVSLGYIPKPCPPRS